MARVAALPADGIPNGIALDQHHGVIYVADSLLSSADRTRRRAQGDPATTE